MDDLFGLFPDLPWFPKRRVDAKLREVRARAEAARERMLRAVAGHQIAIDRKRQAFFRKRALIAAHAFDRRRRGVR
jgi:hypothetical protein